MPTWNELVQKWGELDLSDEARVVALIVIAILIIGTMVLAGRKINKHARIHLQRESTIWNRSISQCTWNIQ